ncbi:MAG: cytochrome b/b6 domain-containing protein [Gemmatimonadetes bacterium]|nr:cytochrome b/b6 domain-containing protein [Gemmatimonadota bacterium]
MTESQPQVVHRHHWIVRVTHWANAIALVLMIGSGLRIYNAFPGFAPRGESFCCWPWEGSMIADNLTFGGWLGGARHWHFAAMWPLVMNGLVYLGFIWLHGEWRDLVPRRGFVRDALAMAKFYLWIAGEHPRQGKHNALQRGAYFVMPYVAAVSVVTGIAIWKPVQLGWLGALMGGYAWARYWHFLAMAALIVLSVGHVIMVLAVDPYSLRAMLTGRYNASLSPEARNARPLVNLLPRRAAKAEAPDE